MHGNLDPEENVMEESVMHPGQMLGQLSQALEKLNWDIEDDVVVESAGVSISGIDVGENYNKKWQSPIGTRKYNKDAFIVIKNLSKNPFEPSKPMGDEFNPKHTYEPVSKRNAESQSTL
mgnify:CR=1 FL=1